MDTRLKVLQGCLMVTWECEGGFGQIIIYEKNGVTFIDSEGMSKEFVRMALNSLVDESILV